jgi:apolipoprotein D and lipocalin family protein
MTTTNVLLRGLALACLMTLGACATAPPLETKPVDLERYQGRWFDVAHLPAPFQRGCACTTATYSLRDDGNVNVDNKCLQGDKPDEARGIAKPAGEPGQLRVSFFWPFSGDYNVIALDDEYGWAVVGSKSRKYAWILSRKPSLDDEQQKALVGKLASEGYETDRLVWTDQSSSTCADVNRS